MRNSVPMWGSTASNRLRSAADPLAAFAEHVTRAPGVRLLSRDLLILALAVPRIPRALVQFRRFSPASAARVLPFRFRGQPIEFAGPRTQPFRVFVRRMLRHADR